MLSLSVSFGFEVMSSCIHSVFSNSQVSELTHDSRHALCRSVYVSYIQYIYTYDVVLGLCRYCVHDSLVLLHALNFDPLNAGGPDD